MNRTTKATLKAGVLEFIGSGIFALALLSLPLVGVLFTLAVIAAAGKAGKTPSPPLLLVLLSLACIPVHLGFFGLVTIAAGKRRVTPGTRVASLPMVVLALGVAALTIAVLAPNPQPFPVIMLPTGVILPLVIVGLWFFEKPSPAIAP